MNEMQEVGAAEMAKVEGGMMPSWLMNFLDGFLGGATGGLVGYGANGIEGPYKTAYKNPPGGP